MTAGVAAACVLLLASGFAAGWPGGILAAVAAGVALVAAAREGGLTAAFQAAIAALLPCVLVLIAAWPDARLAAFPLAAAGLEHAALTGAIRSRERLVEAWLALGARPLEVLPKIRSKARPAILAAIALIVPAIAKPDSGVWFAHASALLGIAIAALAVSVLVALRMFVDSRLIDRPPPEASAPFRLKPYGAASNPPVYESRPGRQPPEAT